MSSTKDLNKQDIQRRYSYFTTGYELDRAYWDILVKKSDNLLTIVITYTSIAVDVKAKLLCYAALAGAYLIIHVQYQPFDDRKNVLCDRIEFMGLVVRFLIFAMFEMLMIFQFPLWFSISIAVFVCCASITFIVTIVTHICCEFLADLTSQTGDGVKVSEDIFERLRAKLNQEESKTLIDKMIACFKSCFKCVGTCCVEPIIRLGFAFARAASSVWRDLEQDALCLMPAGTAVKRMQSRVGRGKGRSCCSRFRYNAALRFFYQKDSDQREFIVTVIAGFFSHIMCHLEEERLEIGDGLLGRFLAVCAALKECNVNQEIPMGISAPDKAEILKSRINSSILHAQKFSMFDDDDDLDVNGMDGIMGPGEEHDMNEKNFKDVQKLRLTGEDLNEGLMLLQRLDGGTVNDLMNEAKRALNQVKEEAQTANLRGQQSMAQRNQQAMVAAQVSRQPASMLMLNDELKQPTNASPFRDIDEDISSAPTNPWKSKALSLMGICPPGSENDLRGDQVQSISNGNGHPDGNGHTNSESENDQHRALMDRPKPGGRLL
jgi:hypothetical protein